MPSQSKRLFNFQPLAIKFTNSRDRLLSKMSEISTKNSFEGVVSRASDSFDYGTSHEQIVVIEQPKNWSSSPSKKFKDDSKRSAEKGLDVFEASFSYIKGSLSSGYVTIPLCFVLLGFIPSLVVGILIAFTHYFTISQLDRIATEAKVTKYTDYSLLVHKILGRRFSYAVKGLQFLYCFGAALAELVFTIEFTAGTACLMQWDKICQDPSHQYAIVLFIITPLVMITKMHQLSYASLIATVIQISFYVFIIIYLLFELKMNDFGKSHFSSAVADHNLLSIFEVFGVLMYTISNATNPLEVRKSLTNVSNFPKVLKNGCVVTAVVALLLGCTGPFLNQIRKVNEIILMELPTDNTFIISVELLFAISITVNFLVFGFGIFEPLEQIDKIREFIFDDERKEASFLKRYLVRMFFVCSIFLLTAAIPNLTVLVSLVGSLNAGLLILVFPSLMTLKFYEGRNDKKNLRLLSWIILVAGTVFTLIGTISNAVKIISPSPADLLVANNPNTEGMITSP